LKGGRLGHARLIRVVRFRATHRYGRREWSAERNRDVFGAQVEPHAHDWHVEVHVRGPIDPDTGWVVDLGVLDAALGRLTAEWDGGDLNHLIPEVADGLLMPSTEELARWIFTRLEGRLGSSTMLVQVRVFESDALGATYPA
jgi:6-pyruvoyltetrahydropterin/6-carboxytetrahydropterin synthase